MAEPLADRVIRRIGQAAELHHRLVIDSPSFFPFRIKPIHAESLVAASSRLDILRHGLDHDLVLLKNSPVRGGGK